MYVGREGEGERGRDRKREREGGREGEGERKKRKRLREWRKERGENHCIIIHLYGLMFLYT